MYPWIDFTHTHLGGQCLHMCDYCSIQAITKRFGNPRYQGDIRLVEKELAVNYGENRTIFIESNNDLFEQSVPAEWIIEILKHCHGYPNNIYVFQTKNPKRYFEFEKFIPAKSIIGTTIETNRDDLIQKHSFAPLPYHRYQAMRCIDWPRKFVTIEPVMDFNPEILADWILEIKPEFLNLGADSKHNKLEEPSIEKIEELVRLLHEGGIELREKHNLERLRKK